MKIKIGFGQLMAITPFDGTEGCGFLTGNTEEITAIVATPSLKPSRFQYSIGFPAWQQMRATAKETGIVIWGTIHSHPDGPLGPSEKDLDIASRLRGREVRAVWHPRSQTLTFYKKQIISQERVAAPLWFRALAKVLFI